ncbi:MAG TPA: histidine triad nucleotide-binding protein [Silvibacterium sp.]|nr:histidine triad nucleotide-binding protein [Silvibacterium sp.]
MDCIFCKIAAGEIPVNKLYEDDQAVAFSDADPQAPVHTLILPRKHIASLAEIGATDEEKKLLGHLHGIANQLAIAQGLGNGYRIVINVGPGGGQTVGHLHVHLLGGRKMHWPPG